MNTNILRLCTFYDFEENVINLLSYANLSATLEIVGRHLLFERGPGAYSDKTPRPTELRQNSDTDLGCVRIIGHMRRPVRGAFFIICECHIYGVTFGLVYRRKSSHSISVMDTMK